MSVTVKESIVVDSGRIHEILSYGLSLDAMDLGTWSELFKTQGYHRRHAAMLRILTHAHRMIRRKLGDEGLDWSNWTVKIVGSKRRMDVIERYRQVYEIVRIRD